MNLYLIGYRGCGKSTVAPLVAEQIGWAFVDTDDYVEFVGNMTIADIFNELGEEEFRRRENDAVRGVAERSEVVVSLGGGALLSEDNRRLIRGSGRTVWLNAAPEKLWQRISADEMTDQRRPDLTGVGGLAEVETLLALRVPTYEACSDYMIDVGRLTPEEAAQQIVAWGKRSFDVG